MLCTGQGACGARSATRNNPEVSSQPNGHCRTHRTHVRFTRTVGLALAALIATERPIIAGMHDRRRREPDPEAAERGDARAQKALGDSYHRQGPLHDDRKAVEWYRRSAAQGHAPALYMLGGMYEGGRGVPQDYGKAMESYREAADQGFASAQACVGYMYECGRGVLRDYEQALAWYLRAAGKENRRAQYLIGDLYARGKGVTQDDVRAYAWLSCAAAQDFPKARASMDSLDGRMTSEQLSEAKTLVFTLMHQRPIGS